MRSLRGTSGRSRNVIAAFITVLIILMVGAVASANSFGYGGGNYAANNGVHEVYFSIYLDADLATDTQHSVDWAFNPHSSIIAYRGFTYRSANDARVYDGNYGWTSWYAAAPCPVGATIGGSGQGTYCKARWVQYNRGYWSGAFDTQAERRHFACHELGHTLGLYHDSSGCMRTSGVSYYVGLHNQDHLYFYG